MDGLNLVFLTLIYVLAGLFILGLIFLLKPLFNKTERSTEFKKAAKFLSIPVGLTVLYILYQVFSNLLLMKPTERDLIGVYKVTDVTNLNMDKYDSDKSKLVIESDSTYVFSLPFQKIKETGKFELNYDEPYHELTFYSKKGMRSGHVDRHRNGFSLRIDLTGEDSRQRLCFDKIQE